MKIKHFLMMLLCTAGVTFMTASCEDLFPLDNEDRILALAEESMRLEQRV